MTIQDSIIQALQASHEAHQAGLTALVASQTAHQAALVELDQLRTDKAALEARVADLESAVAYHEGESVKLVDPEIVSPLLEWLSRAVEATHAAIPQAAAGTPATQPAAGEATAPPPVTEQMPSQEPAAPPHPAAPVANENLPVSPPEVAIAATASAPPPPPAEPEAPAEAPHVQPVVLQFEDVQPHYPERTTPHEGDGDKMG